MLLLILCMYNEIGFCLIYFKYQSSPACHIALEFVHAKMPNYILQELQLTL